MHKGSMHECAEARYLPREKDCSVQGTDRPAESSAFTGVVVERARKRRDSQSDALDCDRPLSDLFLDGLEVLEKVLSVPRMRSRWSLSLGWMDGGWVDVRRLGIVLLLS